MSSTFSTPRDEDGSAGANVYYRRMEDIAVDMGSYWLLNRTTGQPNDEQGVTFINKRRIILTKPIRITASAIVFFTTLPFSPFLELLYIGTEPMFQSIPLRKGIATSFTISGIDITVAAIGNRLKDDDIVKIIGGRIPEYEGRFAVKNVTTDTFDITPDLAVLVNSTVTVEWLQTAVRVTGMSDAGGDKTRIAMADHPFVTGDWINVRNAGNGFDLTFKIENVLADSVDVDRLFNTNVTAEVNVSPANVVFFDTIIINLNFQIGSTVIPKFADFRYERIQGAIPIATIFSIRAGSFTNFEIGRITDAGLCTITENAVLINCYGLEAVDCGFANVVVATNLIASPFPTSLPNPLPFFTIAGNKTQISGSTILGLNTTFKNEAAINVRPGIFPTDEIDFSGVKVTGEGDFYMKGKLYKSAGLPSGGTTDKLIPLPDTIGMLVNDTLTFSESSTFNSLNATIGALTSQTNVQLNTHAALNASPTGAIGSGSAFDLGIPLTVALIVSDSEFVGLKIDDSIEISGVTPTAYNGIHKVVDIIPLFAGAFTQGIVIFFGFSGAITGAGTATGDAAITIKNTSIKSLDQTDINILGRGNSSPDSQIAGGWFADGVSSVTPGLNDLTFVDFLLSADRMVFSYNERIFYDPVDTNGKTKYTGLRQGVSVNFPLSLTLDPSAANNFSLLVKAQIDRGTGFVDLDDLIESEVFFKGSQITALITRKIVVNTGDEVKFVVKRAAVGTTNITVVRSDMMI